MKRFGVLFLLAATLVACEMRPPVDDTPPRLVSNTSNSPVQQGRQGSGETVAMQAAQTQPTSLRPIERPASGPTVAAQVAAQAPAARPVPSSKREPLYPWFASKTNMSLAEFAKAHEQSDQTKLRVGWKGYSDDLKAIHGVPVGDTLESFVAFLRSTDIEIIPCTKEILAKNVMGASTKDGSRRQYTYVRKNCYDGEQLVRHIPSGRVLFSLGCGNVLRPITQTVQGGGMPAITCQTC